MFVLDTLRPRKDGDFDIHVSPRIAPEEERKLVFVAPVEEFLWRVAVDVGGCAESAYHIDKVHAHHFVARRAVHDGENGIVLSGIVIDKARGHKVRVGDTVVAILERRAVGNRLAGGSPCLVRRVYQLVRLVHGVVPKQLRIAIVDTEVEVVGIGSLRMVEVVEGDMNLLRIADEGNRVAGNLVEHDFHRLQCHPVPKRVERHTGVWNRAVRLVIERNRERMHLFAHSRLVDAELGTRSGEHLVERLLPGEDDILIVSRLEFELHLIPILGELRPAFGFRREEHAVLVEDVCRNAAHMVGKHISTLQVIIVLEGEIQPAGARLKVVVNVITRSKHRSQCHRFE